MNIAVNILVLLARAFYRSSIAHSDAMKGSLADMDAYDTFRSGELDVILAAAARYGVNLSGVRLVDLGCNDGAITRRYGGVGPREVIGVDINAAAIERATRLHAAANVSFRVSGIDRLPLDDGSVDVIVSYDVFEHIAKLDDMLAECRRVLRPGGTVLAGTWSWRHPFAPHLWSVMPVPWAHVVFSERTMLRACREVYLSPWYRPTMHDLDAGGNRFADKYTETSIYPDYLNKLLIRDYHRLLAASGLQWRIHPVPFSSPLARWTKIFLRVPWLREFITGYLWVVLRKPKT
ncbi:MAG: class I SAM-dependent methyltransferase [Planctomycetota bacterium]